MRRFNLYLPQMSGHERAWLRALVYSMKPKINSLTIYTMHESSLIFDAIDETLLNVEICRQLTPNNLFKVWKNSLQEEDSIGIIWSADKILHKFTFCKGSIRLLVMRPYLESKTFLGMSRFLIKKLLIYLIRFRRNIDIAQLAIPFSRQGKSEKLWVRDDLTLSQFRYPEAAQNSTEVSHPLSVRENSIIVTTAGFLSKRKNPQLIYETFRKIQKGTEKDVYLCLAGFQQKDWKEETKDWDLSHVEMIDRYLDELVLKEVIERSNLILLPYKNRGASGLAINGLVLGTPVLISGSKHWKNLERISQGYLVRSALSSEELSRHALNQILMPRKSSMGILVHEPIESLSNFLLK